MSPQLKAELTHQIIPDSNASALMTVAEVCAFAKCGRTFFYREVAAKRLQLFKLGTATRCKRSDVQEWLNKRLVPASSEVA